MGIAVLAEVVARSPQRVRPGCENWPSKVVLSCDAPIDCQAATGSAAGTGCCEALGLVRAL